MSIRGAELVEKTEQLKNVLRELGAELPDLEIADHWEADLCAVGLIPISRPTLLAYVSCYKKRSGQIDYVIEESGADVETIEDAPVSRLIAAIRSRLGGR